MKGKEKGGTGGQHIGSLRLIFTSRWLSELRQVVFSEVQFSHRQNGHHIIATAEYLGSGLGVGDFCAGGL